MDSLPLSSTPGLFGERLQYIDLLTPWSTSVSSRQRPRGLGRHAGVCWATKIADFTTQLLDTNSQPSSGECGHEKVCDMKCRREDLA